MALVVKDRVKETSTTTGTGTLTLAGAVGGFQSFSVIGDGNTCYYAIVDADAGSWEVGLGTYTASGTTLSRDTILESSNSGSAVNFGSGEREVFVTYPAEKAVYYDANGAVTLTDSMTIEGNLTVQGTTTTIEATNLAVADNMIYLRDGETTGNVDLGFAGNYNDGTYAHAGFFRDATDGRWKVFDGYTPEPDAATDINTGHASFALADFQAANFIGDVTGDVTGNVTGNVTGDVTGNADTATALATSRTIGLSGDVAGSASFDGSANITISTTIADDSHNHTIANVDGLQTALDAKLASSSYTAADVLTKIKTVDGAGSGLDADLLDGQSSAYYYPASNPSGYTTNVGDITGVTAGSGLTGGGTSGTVTVSHADTSSVADVNNSGNTFIQDLTFDTYGHVTGTTSASLTLGTLAALDTVNAATITDNSVGAAELNVTGNGTTSQYLRSDGDGTFTWATPPDTNTTYSVGNGGLTEINFTSALNSKLAGIESGATADQSASEILTAIKTVDGSGSGLDADTLDGQQGSYYYSSANPPTGTLSKGLTYSTSDPSTSTNPSTTGHIWVNYSSGETYVCTDNTSGSNWWINVGGGSGDITPTMPVWWLAVAGGGGAGYFYGSGGGGGGYLEATAEIILKSSSHTVTVGGGGSGSGSSGSRGSTGGNSVFSDGTAYGGGGGGGRSISGGTGGSGGGSATGSPGSSNQTSNGGGTGYGFSGQYSSDGGGGGGAGGNAPAPGTSRAGGEGRTSSITGSSYIYAPGGRGQNANAGQAPGWGNKGSGGNGDGGGGYSGQVVIRYSNAYGALSIGSGLGYTSTTSGSDRVYIFTSGTGTVTFPSS